jgi:hypothetical protein
VDCCASVIDDTPCWQARGRDLLKLDFVLFVAYGVSILRGARA